MDAEIAAAALLLVDAMLIAVDVIVNDEISLPWGKISTGVGGFVRSPPQTPGNYGQRRTAPPMRWVFARRLCLRGGQGGRVRWRYHGRGRPWLQFDVIEIWIVVDYA